MPRRLSYDFVKSQFEAENFILISKVYLTSGKKLNYECPNGHKHSMRWDDWRAGKRCPYCAGNAKRNYQEVYRYFSVAGYTLITTTYKNNSSELECICPEGHNYITTWQRFKKGHRCGYCFGSYKLTIDHVRQAFESANYILLSKNYKNSATHLKYTCSKGHRGEMTWNNWQQGKRCSICSHIQQGISIMGPNHPNWQGGISCEPYCVDWTKEYKEFIKERDGNMCLNPACLGNSSRLVVHHIDYNKKNCAIDNLITLCNSCNTAANVNRVWYTMWYKSILYRRYGYELHYKN